MDDVIPTWLRLYDAAQLALRGQAPPEALATWFAYQHDIGPDLRAIAWEATYRRAHPGALISEDQAATWCTCRCPRCMVATFAALESGDL